MQDELEFTGERYIPGVSGSIALEHEHRYRFCLPLVKGCRVLDIACGEGFGSAMMAAQAQHVCGVDIDHLAVAHAKKTYTRDNVRFLVGSCSAIPLPDASFDVVVSFETIEHHDEHLEMMSEIRRVLRPGGALIISSPDRRTYSDLRGFRNEFHVHELYADEFEGLLRAHFGSVATFGQRIVYGSALLPLEGSAEVLSFGIDQTEPVPGLYNPLYLVAIASDDPDWARCGHGGVLEETVFRSEAVIERTMAGERTADELRTQVARLEALRDAGERREEALRQKVSFWEASNVDEARRADDLKLQLSQLRALFEAQKVGYESALQENERAAAFHWDEVLRLRAVQTSLVGSVEALQQENDKVWRSWYRSTVMRRLAFHSSGRPRGWMRSLLLEDKTGTPRQRTRRILFRKNGSVRPSFERWYNGLLDQQRLKLLEEQAAAQKMQPEYAAMLRAQMESGALASARTLVIVTTPHTEFIGEAMVATLRRTRLHVSRSVQMPDEFTADLYVVVAPQMFASLPPGEKTILVQMEQVRASHWVDDAYLARLRDCLAVLDYSRDNIEALTERGLPYKQLYFMPIRPLRRPVPSSVPPARDIDVLFYGAINSERRRRYIDALASRVNLRIESDTFGPALRDVLDRTKVVVNVHFYENALLETTRISEALSHGAHVVSEVAEDVETCAEYADMVNFVARGDVAAFVRQVEATLTAWHAPAVPPVDDGFDGMPYHLLRMLNGIGVLSPDELQSACSAMELPMNRLILALPEQGDRYEFARKNRLPGTTFFHALRHIDGWKGCANSYKFLARQALAQGLSQLTIYEDDATFDLRTADRLAVIEAELAARGSSWDIFSGLLSDLHPEANVTGVKTVGQEEFIDLDSAIGMVFGIYNEGALRMLADFEFSGTDTAKHTIDRYIESLRPRTITVMPPLAGHAENLDSTIWPVNNASAVAMIESSITRLADKRRAFLHSASQPSDTIHQK